MRLALGAATLLVATSASAAAPSRVTVVRPAHPNATTIEAAMRLQAELAAAGFTVVLVEADPERDPRAVVDPAVRPSAIVILLATDRGTAAEVRGPDHLARRVDAGATAESSQPAALAIRAVELVRASLLEASARAPASPATRTLPDDLAPAKAAAPRESPRPRPVRALLERFTVELGLAAIYGLGDTAGRLAPTARLAYGAGMGLAGRLTVTGPTSTDQMALVELAYGFDRSWQLVTPVVSVGAGGCHAHLDDTAKPSVPRLVTEAWAGVLSASAGVAVRATDRASFVIDGHALLVEPAPGAVVGAAPAGGRPQLALTASIGVVAGF